MLVIRSRTGLVESMLIASLWPFCNPIPALTTGQKLWIWIITSLVQNLILIIEILLHCLWRTKNKFDLEENRTNSTHLSYPFSLFPLASIKYSSKNKNKKCLEWLQCYLVNERKREVYFYRANSKHNLFSNKNFCFVDYFNMPQNE